MREALPYLLTALEAYLLGSISFSIIFTWLFKREDIREYGSGNAGATNVLRSVGKLPALLTLVGDFGKGVLAVVIGRIIFGNMSTQVLDGANVQQVGACVAGLFALLGHCFPVFFKFRGGKGVLTAAGIMFIISPKVFLCCFVAFFIVILASRIVSLASISAAVTYPIATFIITYFFEYRALENVPSSYWIISTVSAAVFGGLVIFMHRSNIKRLIDGTESRLTVKKGD